MLWNSNYKSIQSDWNKLHWVRFNLIKSNSLISNFLLLLGNLLCYVSLPRNLHLLLKSLIFWICGASRLACLPSNLIIWVSVASNLVSFASKLQILNCGCLKFSFFGPGPGLRDLAHEQYTPSPGNVYKGTRNVLMVYLHIGV